MLPPVALLAVSLFFNVTGPVCPNPCTSSPTEWVPNPISIPFTGAQNVPVAPATAPAPKASPVVAAAPAPRRLPHVSIRDYTTAARMQTASFTDFPALHSDSEDVSLSPDEAALLADLNLERTSRGLTALTLDPSLVSIARAHSEDMFRRDYFDHIAPAPGPASPMDRYLAALDYRPDYAMVGENIYYRSLTDGLTQSATEANDAFMHSPGHRANILQPLYTKVGIGIYRNPQTGEFWVTEMFLSVSPQP